MCITGVLQIVYFRCMNYMCNTPLHASCEQGTVRNDQPYKIDLPNATASLSTAHVPVHISLEVVSHYMFALIGKGWKNIENFKCAFLQAWKGHEFCGKVEKTITSYICVLKMLIRLLLL